MALPSTPDSWGTSSFPPSAQAGFLPLSHTTPDLLSPLESWDKTTRWTRWSSLSPASKCWAVLWQWQFRLSCWTSWRKDYGTCADLQLGTWWGEGANAVPQCAYSLPAHGKPDVLRTYRTGQVVGVVCLFPLCQESQLRQISCAPVRDITGTQQSCHRVWCRCACCCWTQAGSDQGKNTFPLCYMR